MSTLADVSSAASASLAGAGDAARFVLGLARVAGPALNRYRGRSIPSPGKPVDLRKGISALLSRMLGPFFQWGV
jgi:hypothetical protein